MRTVIYNKLTNNEIEEYLQGSDLIFLPVGVTEMHGALPVDCETVLAQAISVELAKRAGGLVLNDLAYFYAGATVTGRGTLEVSIRAGIDYLYEILRSLVRQGFRRIVFVTFHAPAYLTVSAALRDFFDEYHIPMLYIDACKLSMSLARDREFLKTGAIPSEFEMNDFFFGAYDILGRLSDIPLTTRDILDCSKGTNTTAKFAPFAKVGPMSGSHGFYSGDKQDHAPTPVIKTEEERQARADRGRKVITSLSDYLGICKLVDLMNDLDEFNKELISRTGDWLEFC